MPLGLMVDYEKVLHLPPKTVANGYTWVYFTDLGIELLAEENLRNVLAKACIFLPSC